MASSTTASPLITGVTTTSDVLSTGLPGTSTVPSSRRFGGMSTSISSDERSHLRAGDKRPRIIPADERPVRAESPTLSLATTVPYSIGDVDSDSDESAFGDGGSTVAHGERGELLPKKARIDNSSSVTSARLAHFFSSMPNDLGHGLAATASGSRGAGRVPLPSVSMITEAEVLNLIHHTFRACLDINSLHPLLSSNLYKCGIGSCYNDLLESMTNVYRTHSERVSRLLEAAKKDNKLARCLVTSLFEEDSHMGHKEIQSKLTDHGVTRGIVSRRVFSRPAVSMPHSPDPRDSIYPWPWSGYSDFSSSCRSDDIYPRSHAFSVRTGSASRSSHDDRRIWLQKNTVILGKALGCDKHTWHKLLDGLLERKLVTPDEHERFKLEWRTPMSHAGDMLRNLPSKGMTMPQEFLAVLFDVARDWIPEGDQQTKNKDLMLQVMQVLCQEAKGGLKVQIAEEESKIRALLTDTPHALSDE